MIKNIIFNNKTYKKININIKPQAEFNDILLVLNELHFEGYEDQEEQIIFAILELLNNSLRAHREKGIDKNILLMFHLQPSQLIITLQDWGGGFDPDNLPYELKEDVRNIDTNNDIFQQYREKFNYLRFGIGLYVVKKTFSTFDLYFIDNQKRKVTWESGLTAGTCVELTLGLENGK